MDLSIIITYHNEGMPFLMECIRQIRATIDVPGYQLIVVDDNSDEEIQPDGFLLIRHDSNRGVGAAFDTGVKFAKSENIILMACDIRFIDNGWAGKLLTEINNHPKAITCTTCVALNRDEEGCMDLEARQQVKYYNGATMLMFHSHLDDKNKSSDWRGIIEAKWYPQRPVPGGESYEVPCILGAIYGVKKQWYQYIDGFAMHYHWGTLEPYISLKSWFFGGSCRTAPEVVAGHIFKKHGTHGTSQAALMCNKLMVTSVLFDQDDRIRLSDFLGNGMFVQEGKSILASFSDMVQQKREEYLAKIVIDRDEFFSRWNINWKPTPQP